MDGFTAATISGSNSADENVLNTLPKIIIKKENIGLEEHQHQKYQYSLFNNIVKLDHYYEDLARMKDRLDKTSPNMQRVIHADMKRLKSNKVYERLLDHVLTGPRGLDWQRKQQMQRLENSERGIERDLVRLHRDRTRVCLISPRERSTTSLFQNNDTVQAQATSTAPPINIDQSLKPAKIVLKRSISLNTSRPSLGRLTKSNDKRLSLNQSLVQSSRSWYEKQTLTQVSDGRPYFQQHALVMDQKRREFEQKLKSLFE